jgi:lipopolysaccharide/colanic/teichoic acid biosynthesis glycosyltransferase
VRDEAEPILAETENAVIALDAVKVHVTPTPPGPNLSGLRPDGAWGRWWQVAIAALGLLLTLPISLAVALATKLTSRGPVLYRGTRIGRNMEPFSIYKFRTLLVDAEQRIGARLLTPGDPLYTPIGRFLKRTKLDEIPQLLNVVRGDMNLVGPRPIRPIFLATSMREIQNYAARFVVRPGMTGLAQLRGGYFTHPRDKLRYDILYIRNRTMLLDVKLVLGTFVKLLNRWLTLGLLLALIFLSATFLPTLFHGPVELALGGFNVSPFEAMGLLLVGAALARQIPAHRLYIYRTPTNWPMLAFVAFSVVTAFATGEVIPRLRDLAYFSGSGFLLFFLVVSGDMDAGFARRATRVIALAAVAVALVGVLEVMLRTQAGDHIPRITSTLGSPVVLAAYLVLGLPLVLVELVCAEGREERDFWVACTTTVVIGVVLTQTRTSLIALWLAAAVFTWRISRRTFRLVVGSALAFASVLVFVGSLKVSPSDLKEDWTRRVSVTEAAVETDLWSTKGLVGTEPGKGASSKVSVPGAAGGEAKLLKNENMHLTLMLRTGLVGWALMMWIVGAALAGMYAAMAAVTDRRLALTLWAAFSSGVGFLVSMSNFNAFYDSTIQVFFWGLLGIGMAIVVHRNGRRPAFNVIWRFGPGD